MTSAIHPERRTRSQLTLPHNILQIPHRSPLKDARTAMRNHTIVGDAMSADDSEDELLLSPRKKEPQMRVASSSKRSASPPPHDEYTSTTPPEARALKRVKRDSPVGETQSDIENVKTDIRPHKRLGQTHSRTHSDPNILPGRRSARKRSATPGKPFSTVSASPPLSLFSPIATSPRKERAKSVPLFPSTNDIPHIDFRNPPPSPKRNRSPSRSPSKGRTPKLRITSKTIAASQTLPAIQDELPSKMDIDDDASSVLEEAEMPHISASLNPPGVEPEVSEPIPAPPTLIASTSQTMLPTIPATPATQSLNRLIPMSPLTPLPPTPFQARSLSAADAEERYNSDLGWGVAPLKDMVSASEVANPPAAPVPMKSRLPRRSLAPPPSKVSRTTTMGPPTTTRLKTPMMSAQGSATTGQEAPAPKKNAFSVLMNKEARRPQTLDKGKEKMKAKTIKPPPASAKIFKPTDHTGPSTKPKTTLKDKMRPKEKTQQKLPKFVPLPDEEEGEEEYPASSWSPWTGPEGKMEETRHYSPTNPEMDAQPKRASPESLEPTSAVEDPVMESAEDRNVTSTPAFASPDTPMVDADIRGQIKSDEPQSAAPEPSQKPLLAVVDDAITQTGAESEELVGGNAAGVVETREPPAAEPTPRPSRASKLPLGKKRQPISVEPAARVTRSTSNSKKIGELSGSTSGLSRSNSMTMGRLPAKRTASGTVKEAALPEETPLAESEAAVEAALPPGSPMKLSSPIRASDKGSPTKKDDAKAAQIGPGKLSLAKTPIKSNFSAQKPASSPSPNKIARSSSYMSMRPPAPGMVRTFSVDTSLVRSGANSSLSTLSNALEKLRMPPPSRPNTSMGFNREFSGDDEEPDVLTKTQDDGKVGRVSLGLGRPDGGLKRAATLGAGAFKAPTTTVAASSSKTASGNQPVQKTLTMFMSSKGSGTHKAGAGPVLQSTGRSGVRNNNKSSIFGGIGGVRRTISKKTPLPMVLGSPVKGGESGDETMADDNKADEDVKTNVTEEPDNNFMAPVNISTATILAEDPTPTEGSSKGRQKETNSFSQALGALPMAKPPAKGLMGPPPTPPSVGNISNRSTGSNASGASSASPSQAGPFGATRSSARIAKSASTLAKMKSGTDGHASSSKGADAASPLTPVPKTQKILDGCVIFVDVKTEAGDEAGSVFVTMLEELGARVQGRVGQSCTHIVYKNGLAGTLTKYRLLRDPKPLVVGIGWVVECAEQQKRVEEAEFLVDLENAHFAGTHKRRRSMLPKMYSSSIPLPSGLDKDQSGDGDRSVDDASTSISLDEDLTPLERVRRRQSILSGPRP